MTYTVKHEWRARTRDVEFLKNNGGHFGVKLAIDIKEARRLSQHLKSCVKNAENHGEESLEIIAHWGHKHAGGFLLRTRVRGD